MTFREKLKAEALKLELLSSEKKDDAERRARWLKHILRRTQTDDELIALYNAGQKTIIDWGNRNVVLALPVAQDWAKPFIERVRFAQSVRRTEQEAVLATIEALTRKLRTRGWKRHYSSAKGSKDGRVHSRYYTSPRGRYYIRISNHVLRNGEYKGAKEYIIDGQILLDFNVLGLINLIERDERCINITMRE